MHKMEQETIPNWAIHRRLYEWVLSFASKPFAAIVLLCIAFIEAFVPFVPPDALLIPMCLKNRQKSGVFAAIATLGSVSGAMVGYFVIAALIASGTQWAFGAEVIEHIVSEFDKRGTSYVFIAALTPVPFFALTTAAGVAKLNFGMFLAACIVGRSLRYGIEAGIVWWIGEPAKVFIEKWFNLITIVACVVILAGWIILKFL
jgi:membrane protein YqaA with SNARE-associated domain|tara:strand:+ start:538 stop:1143 length:606 start_codon:yes stop_codon:yes gene_type:complete